MSEERASSEDEARDQPHNDERDAERRARQEVSAGERETVRGHEREQHEDRSRSPTQTEPADHDRSRERKRARTVEVASAGHPSGRAAAASNIDHRPPQPQPRASNPFDVNVRPDLWQELKCVTIPIFTGDKRAYSAWRAAFMACIDKAPATAEYKLLQLRQYLRGDALQAIEGLGHSAAAYDAAKARLDRKYGGERRRVATHLEAIQQFEAVRLGKAADLDRFADLIEVTVVNLKDAGRTAELRNSTFYQSLQQKLPESLLTQYQRWVFE